jgi:hypothetical protein
VSTWLVGCIRTPFPTIDGLSIRYTQSERGPGRPGAPAEPVAGGPVRLTADLERYALPDHVREDYLSS